MAEERNIRIEDEKGNTYYPHTKAKTTFLQDGQNLETALADYTSFKDNVNTSLDKLEKELNNYNSFSSHKDDNGIFTVIEYKRTNNTLYMKSTLSNADAEGNYTNMTWEFYNTDGTEVMNTVVWNINYDEDGDIVSKVVSV